MICRLSSLLRRVWTERTPNKVIHSQTESDDGLHGRQNLRREFWSYGDGDLTLRVGSRSRVKMIDTCEKTEVRLMESLEGQSYTTTTIPKHARVDFTSP